MALSRAARNFRRTPRRRVIVGVVGLMIAGAVGSTAGTVGVATVASLAVLGAVWNLRGRRRPERRHVAALRRQAQPEERVAARLDALEVRGWVLLHDRSLDGSGHRVAHLAVGPSGVVIVTPFPIRDAVTTAGDQLFVDGLPYSPWLATRAWETYQVSEALTARLEPGWLTVTTQWAVAVGKPLPAGLRLWNAIGLCQLEDLEHLLTSAPATLHREAVAYLAGVLMRPARPWEAARHPTVVSGQAAAC